MRMFIAAVIVASGVSGCVFRSERASVPSTPTPEPSAAATAQTPRAADTPTVSDAARQDCFSARLDGKVLVRSQTFAFDHKPFEGSCFVTFGDRLEMLDDKDVPRGSRFYIFSGGRQAYEFPDPFGGLSGCWVEAVAFNDLNDDGLTDVVVAGLCLGARASFASNAVYMNTGTEFITNEEANAELDEFSRIDQIRTFVRKNLDRFF